VALETVLSARPLLVAMALRVVVVLMVIAAVYTVPVVEVGRVPLVV